MKNLIYAPQPNATPDEVLQVLKVFSVHTLPDNLRNGETLMTVYSTLPPDAQRHFKIVETPNELR
jgi:hypothetical protein